MRRIDRALNVRGCPKCCFQHFSISSPQTSSCATKPHILRYRRIGYNLNVIRQSACLIFNPITVDNYDSSSLTNEKDHHYFLNSADVCW